MPGSDNLRKEYSELFPKLKEVLEVVNSKLSDLSRHDFHIETALKPFKSVKRKAIADQVSKLDDLSDLARGRIYFSSSFEINDVVEMLKKMFGKQIKKVDAKRKNGEKEKCLEYHGTIHLDMNINGVPFELQVIPQEHEPFKHLLHYIYEKIRSPKTKLSDEQTAFLCKVHNKLYEKLNAKTNENRDTSLINDDLQVNMKKRASVFRQLALFSNKGFTKVAFDKTAFDTRRINQEIDYNPRRGLQNYIRSEAFISQALSQKLQNFAKLRDVLNELKDFYGKEHEWQDSNARILLSTLNIGLRSEAQDGDYSTNQPGMGSLDYIEELLHMRYRLGFDELSKLSNFDLKQIILSKDEKLIHKDLNKILENKPPQQMVKQTYDSLMEKLFSFSAPTNENKTVSRSITITIKDSIDPNGITING